MLNHNSEQPLEGNSLDVDTTDNAKWQFLSKTRWTSRLRVPGGWIYRVDIHTSGHTALVFVPDAEGGAR